jgi:hypothetical protein
MALPNIVSAVYRSGVKNLKCLIRAGLVGALHRLKGFFDLNLVSRNIVVLD